jgi:AcrR family transcriptional regulator
MKNNEAGKKDTKDSKKNAILEAGKKLFSEKGFAAVGVRDIAKEANVNISMISYYYGGKSGILKEILTDFFTKYYEIAQNAVDESENPFDFIENIVDNIVPFFVKNSREVIIFATEMPLDSSDITEFKAEKIKGLLNIFKIIFIKAGIAKEDENMLGIIGPTFFSVIYSHFLFKPVISEVFDVEKNENFYDKYKEVIKTILKGAVRELRTNYSEDNISDNKDV